MRNIRKLRSRRPSRLVESRRSHRRMIRESKEESLEAEEIMDWIVEYLDYFLQRAGVKPWKPLSKDKLCDVVFKAFKKEAKESGIDISDAQLNSLFDDRFSDMEDEAGKNGIIIESQRKSSLTEAQVIRKIARIIAEAGEPTIDLDDLEDYNHLDEYDGPIIPDGKKISIGCKAEISFAVEDHDLIVTIYHRGKVLDSIREEGIVNDRYKFPMADAREIATEIINDNISEIRCISLKIPKMPRI